jgi:ribosome-interacting GTPase 1
MSDTKSLTNEAKQYIALKEQIAFLQDRQKEIKSRLTDAVKELGEVDGRGHITLELEGGIKLTNQRRESRSLDEDYAVNLLKEKGIYEECIKVVEVLQEDSIMAAVYKGQLTEEDVDTMFPTKVTYAFLI